MVFTLAGQVDTKSPEHEGLRFEARVQVRAEGGTTAAEGQQIVVKNADAVTMMMVGATNYRLKYPDYRGTDPARANTQTLQSLAKKSWVELREAHGADFKRLFGRVSLTLAGPAHQELPTDARVQQYKKTRDDRGLEALVFQFGRYLLIASSRPGGLPANLQGLWNESNTPPWNGDYHLNINLQIAGTRAADAGNLLAGDARARPVQSLPRGRGNPHRRPRILRPAAATAFAPAAVEDRRGWPALRMGRRRSRKERPPGPASPRIAHGLRLSRHADPAARDAGTCVRRAPDAGVSWRRSHRLEFRLED